jgi:hypothetical protein
VSKRGLGPSRTSQRWLNFLGLKYGAISKGIYHDGHERPDVQNDRTIFLQRMLLYEPRMLQYIGPEAKPDPDFKPPDGQQRIVLVVHDESTFYSNDGRKMAWKSLYETVLKKKGMGRSIMVSDFLCECHGPLQYTDENGEIIRTRETIKPGKNNDGWWTNAQLVAQLQKTIQIFKKLHENCQALFAFDNSQNHNAFPDDALIANRLNLSDGEKNVKFMKDGFYGNPRRPQEMQHFMDVKDGERKLVQKGLRQILLERELWSDGLKRKCAGTCPGDGCCAVSLLEAQEDFSSQRSWLEETVLQAGHEFILFPKFHCELSFIELFWGEAKRIARANCDYSFASLEANLDSFLDEIPVERIRKYARHCYRYMDAYRKGLTPALAAYATKMYRGHRMILNPELAQREFEKASAKKKKT